MDLIWTVTGHRRPENGKRQSSGSPRGRCRTRLCRPRGSGSAPRGSRCARRLRTRNAMAYLDWSTQAHGPLACAVQPDIRIWEPICGRRLPQPPPASNENLVGETGVGARERDDLDRGGRDHGVCFIGERLLAAGRTQPLRVGGCRQVRLMEISSMDFSLLRHSNAVSTVCP